MADLNAKEGTQETLVSLIGMLLGIALARYLHDLEQRDVSLTATVSWTIFVILTIVHVWANYVGVKLLRLRTLNRERATVTVNGIVEHLAKNSTKSSSPGLTVTDSLHLIPTPEQVSESLWASTRKLLLPCRIRLGVQAKVILDELGPQQMITTLIKEFADELYMVAIVGQDRIYVALCVGASDQDELKAFVHAMTIQKCLERAGALKLDGKHDELISRYVIASGRVCPLTAHAND